MLKPRTLLRPAMAPAAQRGMSLVELLVGVAVGLFIVAGAAAVVGGQLGDTRRLVTETQLQQDLRGAADLVVRDMRRAGHSRNAAEYVWGDGAAPSVKNLSMEFSPASTTASSTQYKYDRATNETGFFGFRLSGGVIQVQVSNGNWQDLTDSRVMNVSTFSIAPRVVSSAQLPCAKNCPDGTTNCWPTVSVREIDVVIEAAAKADAAVKRTIRSTVRLRNDRVNYNVVATPDQLCPL
jgi:prepilin-type N-terminal cleavage/methylation domain-containing protein